MNALVQQSSGGTVTAFCTLYDPREARDSRVRFRRDHVASLRKANSLFVPSGRWAASGWVLVVRADYANVNPYRAVSLDIDNPAAVGNVSRLNNLYIVQAQCVTTGLISDANALYLVELTDARGLAHNRWFQAPIASQYNIRVPAYPETFFLGSMRANPPSAGFTTWTWNTMLGDMWGTVSTAVGGALGVWPNLPAAPTGTPEGWWFEGVPGWHSLCDAIEHLGFVVACDLQQATAPFTIVQSSAPDPNLEAAFALHAARLEDDGDWLDLGSGRVPVRVVVYFRRRNAVYGTEETVRFDSTTGPPTSAGPFQWSMYPHYTVTVPCPIQFFNALGTHHMWSDFTVRYDMDGEPLLADVVVAEAIATERVANYYAQIYSAAVGTMTRVYAGALPFTTGSQVDGVHWYMDFQSQDRQGWKTKVTRGRPAHISHNEWRAQ